MKNDKDRYWDCLDQAMEASHGGRTEEALAWLEEALKAHPDGAEAHNGRGELMWDEGRVDEALFEFERAVEIQREALAMMDERENALEARAGAQSSISESLRELGDLEGAIEAARGGVHDATEQPCIAEGVRAQVALGLALATFVVGAPASHAETKSLTIGGFEFSNAITVPGTPEAVFDLFTGDISSWWDHHFVEKPKKLFTRVRSS